MAQDLQPTRRVSLLTTSLAKISEENTRSNTITPVLSSSSSNANAQNTTAALNINSNDGLNDTLFKEEFNFELVPDSTLQPQEWTQETRIQSIAPTETSATRPNSSLTLLPPSQDQLPIYGDEIIPPISPSTPIMGSSPLSTRSPLSQTPITVDSHSARLRRGHLPNRGSSSKLSTHPNRQRSYQKLHRALSESETHKFDPETGRRVFVQDSKYRPTKYNPYDPSHIIAKQKEDEPSAWSYSTFGQHFTDQQKGLDKKYSHLDLGKDDEYLPDLDFAETLKQWDSVKNLVAAVNAASHDASLSSLYSAASSSADVSLSSTPMGPSHSQVGPVSVPRPKRTQEEEEEQIRKQLPEDFSMLPMSARNKVLRELKRRFDPAILQRFEKEAQRNRSSRSVASLFLSTPSMTPRSLKSFEEGSIIMNYVLGRTIGSGAWGLIRECRNEKDPSDLKAMKIIRTLQQSVKSHFMREVNVWHKLNHDYILPLIAVKDTPEAIFCLMPKVDGGNLFDLVSKWGLYSLPEPVTPRHKRLKIIRVYLLQLAEALMYMHSRGIVHGDVKLENCLINPCPPKSKIYLCDFGMSHQFMVVPDNEEIRVKGSFIKRRPSIPRSLSNHDLRGIRSLAKIVGDKSQVHDDTKVELGITDSTVSSESDILSFDASPIEPKNGKLDPSLQLDSTIPDSHIGSLPYAAPELLDLKPPPLGPTADIWAFGVLFFTMVTGKLPFSGNYEPRIRAGIQNGTYDVEAFVEACDGNENFIQVLKGCMERDITKRFTLEDVHRILHEASL